MLEPETKKFTKYDYLTPRQVTEHLDISEDVAYRVMHNLYLKRATTRIKIGTSYSIRPSVIIARYTKRKNASEQTKYRIRSDALEQITEYIKSKQEKGK